MIEINLLPGAGRKARRGTSRLDVASSIASLRERIRQPWLIGSAVATVLAVLVVAGLFLTESRAEARTADALEKALRDSTNFAAVLKERQKAEAKRDTVLRSLNLIRAIDDDRYIWAHIMDEVSKALPPYTWLVSLGYTGTEQASAPVQTLAPVSGDSTVRRKRALLTVIPHDTVRIRLVGNTVDIQALTRFIRDLESSPFLERVSLAKSERSQDHGQEVTQFQLDMLYSRPDPASVRRVPLDVFVR